MGSSRIFIQTQAEEALSGAPRMHLQELDSLDP